MKSSFKRLLSLVAMMAFSAVASFAQVTTSSMNGLVTDEAGDPLTGAAVVAVHVPTGSQYYAVVNEKGKFNIEGMRSGGPYTVEVSFIGMNTVKYTDVNLSLGEPYALSVKMNGSNMLEQVTIVASATKFATDKTGPVTNISSSDMLSVPTVSRSIEDVAKLSPYSNGMSFAGGDGRSSNFTVDGANFNNNFGLNDGLPGGGNPISMDAIQEIQVVIAPYDVRQTNFIGGGVNAITKSGTNELKASAYTLQYNADTHGSKANGKTASSIPSEYANHLYGLTIGGPIIKDKLFFFVSAEYANQPNTFQSWRASDATSSDADATGKREGTADNTSKISRTSKEDLELVSSLLKERYGYDTGSYTDFPATDTDIRLLARVDWNINEKHRLAVRYNYTKHAGWTATNGSSSNANNRASASRFSQYGMSYLNSCYSTDKIAETVTLDLNSRLNDSMNNQFLATYSYLADTRSTGSSLFPFIDILDGTASTAGKILPYISAGYELFTYNNAVKNGIFTVKDDFTWNIGSHHLLAGASFESQYALNSYMRNGSGYYRYESLQDFIDEAAPETVCFTYGYNGESNPAVKVAFTQSALYLQDDWDVTKNLKLTYGSRFDLLAFNNDDIMTNNAVKEVDYNGTHIDTGTWPATRVMVSPRVGFVWDVLGDKSLKVRGGVGMFTGRLPLVYFTNMPTNSNMIQNVVSISTVWTGKEKTEVNPYLAQFAGKIITDRNELLDKLYSIDPVKYPKEINPSDGALGSEIDAVDPGFKMPMVAKLSLGVDYEVPVNFPFTVSAEGMYTKTINGLMMHNINIKSDDSDNWERMPGADNRLIYPANYRYTDTDAYILGNTSQGYGYTANVTLKAQPIKNFNLMAAYTKTESKELTGMPGSAASSVFKDLYSVNGAQFATLQRSQYVIPDRIIASASYTQKWRREGFDTKISLMYEGYSSGGYSFVYDSDINGDGMAYDLIYIPNTPDEIQFASVKDQQKFWNFVKQDKYLNSHRGEYAEAYAARAPWVHQIDLRLTQDFGVKVGGKMNRLQLSADLMNLGNLLNSKWGLPSILDCNSGMVLHCTNVEDVSSTVAPIYSFAAGSDHTYTKSTSFYNCWQLQLGLRYYFN